MMSRSDRVNVGSLSDRVTLQFTSTTDDGMGGTIPANTNLFTTWADIKPLSAKRLLSIDRTVQNTTHEITFRWRNDLISYSYVRATLDNGIRLIHSGKNYIVNTVINVDNGSWTVQCLATQESYD
ncbi:MAG: head-tail adaptor protein [Bacteroidetes bacterium]|nr:head-tail adaptor protein [Bacteroidota bacterium]